MQVHMPQGERLFVLILLLSHVKLPLDLLEVYGESVVMLFRQVAPWGKGMIMSVCRG